MKKIKIPFHLNGLLIIVLSLTGYGLLLSIPLLFLRISYDKKRIAAAEKELERFVDFKNAPDIAAEVTKLQDLITSLKRGYEAQISERNAKMDELEATFVEKESKLHATIVELDAFIESKEVQKAEIISNALNDAMIAIEELNKVEGAKNPDILDYLEYKNKKESLRKKLASDEHKLSRIYSTYKSIHHTVANYTNLNIESSEFKLSPDILQFLDELSPTVTLKMHYMDIQDLKKAASDNSKVIDQTLKAYETRYTTKANKAIYKLMVIAMRAELQNIQYAMKYDKLEKALEAVKQMTEKYAAIAGEGNQSIAGTLARFIGEIEFLFVENIKIEYEWYIRREQAKEEQARLRELLKQEAEERKLLEAQRKQIEAEEEKYLVEINKLKESLEQADSDDKTAKIMERLAELECQLNKVEHKKEEIIKLQNGRAGYVYIISNLGSFGEEVFKVGMTRRLDPQERVNELGDASVPFAFDVHSFIFSDNAVALESSLHEKLNDCRVNKINLRKEFFKTNIDSLEKLVYELDPTAEFNRTMLAEQYRQSISLEDYYEEEEIA